MKTIEHSFTEDARHFHPDARHQKNDEGIRYPRLSAQDIRAEDFPASLRKQVAGGGIKLRGTLSPQPSRDMGSIFWQLNDCWPSPPVSIDYYDVGSAAILCRRFYSPILVSPHVEDVR